MSTAIAAGRRALPRGYTDLLRQCLIWFGFWFAYQVVRGVADHSPGKAFANGLRVLDLEQKATHRVFELSAQQIADSSQFLLTAAAWTYWNSEFTVIGLTLLWVYLRRHEAFSRFRNTILVANVMGLVGYVLLPTAPPRMFPSFGFVDALDTMSGLNHGSGLIQLAANPYAAMPSLHAADALIVGICLAGVVRNRIGKVLWLLWPIWVWFAVMATANHFWLDVVAGVAVAVLAFWLEPRISGRFARFRRRRTADAEPEAARIANLL